MIPLMTKQEIAIDSIHCWVFFTFPKEITQLPQIPKKLQATRRGSRHRVDNQPCNEDAVTSTQKHVWMILVHTSTSTNMIWLQRYIIYYIYTLFSMYIYIYLFRNSIIGHQRSIKASWKESTAPATSPQCFSANHQPAVPIGTWKIQGICLHARRFSSCAKKKRAVGAAWCRGEPSHGIDEFEGTWCASHSQQFPWLSWLWAKLRKPTEQ